LGRFTELGIDLPLCTIGDTGVAIEAKNIQIFGMHDTAPPGKPAGWRGVYLPSVKLHLPGELAGVVGTLELADAYIGHGGFSGSIFKTWQQPLAAGLFGMSLRRFLAYTTLGSAIWSSALAFAGYSLRDNYERVEHWLNPATNAIVAGIVLVYLYRVATWRRHRGDDGTPAAQ
jgi:hypothetical protein